MSTAQREGSRPGRRIGPDEGAWPAPTVDHPVSARVFLPGSKSLTNRFLVLAALAGDTSRLRRPLRSRDTLLMADGLRALGARIDDLPGDDPSAPDWLVEPAPLPSLPGAGDQRSDAAGRTGPDSVHVDCGLAGTVMRFLPPVAALADRPVVFDGDPRARVRPMATGISALRVLGVHVDDNGTGTLPFTVRGTGRVRGGEVTLDASASSQFISALLLVGARFENGITVIHDGKPVPSEPHITMTVEALRDVGVIVDDLEPNRWRVEASAIHALDVQVEPDLSNAAAFVAAAMVTGGVVQVPGWPQHTTQAGDAIRDIFDAMGGDVRLTREGLSVTGPEQVNGLDVDLHDVGELTPVIAAVAALADSPSWLRGVAHLRGHETDRLAALATEITALGGEVIEHDDGLHITPRPLTGGLVHTYADHRMVMAAAVLGLAVPGIVIEDVATVGKTMPDFVTRWTALLEPAP